jgi:hypothetical protein
LAPVNATLLTLCGPVLSTVLARQGMWSAVMLDITTTESPAVSC